MVDESRLLYAICDSQTSAMVGVTSIQSIDLPKREAEIAIMIGEKSHRQRGVSVEAWGLLTQHAFESLPLERIYAGSHEGLRRWVESLTVIGYEIDSEKPDGFVKDGQVVGVLLYSCHRSKFEELVKKCGRFNADIWLNATEGS
jgi:RimJ/RimL family protein N-acetyltransferase